MSRDGADLQTRYCCACWRVEALRHVEEARRRAREAPDRRWTLEEVAAWFSLPEGERWERDSPERRSVLGELARRPELRGRGGLGRYVERALARAGVPPAERKRRVASYLRRLDDLKRRGGARHESPSWRYRLYVFALLACELDERYAAATAAPFRLALEEHDALWRSPLGRGLLKTYLAWRDGRTRPILAWALDAAFRAYRPGLEPVCDAEPKRVKLFRQRRHRVERDLLKPSSMVDRVR